MKTLSNGFSFNEINGVKYLTIDSFTNSGLVKHGISTRYGGVSKKEFESMNLSFTRGDNQESVEKNFKIFCDTLNIATKDLVFTAQTHTSNVLVVSDRDKLGKKLYEPRLKDVDAIVTNQKNVALLGFFADCVPLLFLDTKKSVISVCHSGWQGTLKKIALNTVSVMVEQFGCSPKDILCAIGPSIGVCHFEVDKPVADDFYNVFADMNDIIFKKDNGKYHIDLWKINKKLLISAGFLEENINISGECTYCKNDMYFSHRYSGDKRGSLAAVLELV